MSRTFNRYKKSLASRPKDLERWRAYMDGLGIHTVYGRYQLRISHRRVATRIQQDQLEDEGREFHDILHNAHKLRKNMQSHTEMTEGRLLALLFLYESHTPISFQAHFFRKTGDNWDKLLTLNSSRRNFQTHFLRTIVSNPLSGYDSKVCYHDRCKEEIRVSLAYEKYMEGYAYTCNLAMPLNHVITPEERVVVTLFYNNNIDTYLQERKKARWEQSINDWYRGAFAGVAV